MQPRKPATEITVYNNDGTIKMILKPRDVGSFYVIHGVLEINHVSGKRISLSPAWKWAVDEDKDGE